MVKLLLEHKAKINMLTSSDDSALHLSCCVGGLESVKILLAHEECDTSEYCDDICISGASRDVGMVMQTGHLYTSFRGTYIVMAFDSYVTISTVLRTFIGGKMSNLFIDSKLIVSECVCILDNVQVLGTGIGKQHMNLLNNISTQQLWNTWRNSLVSL